MAVSEPAQAAVRHATTRECFLALREAGGALSVAEIAARTGLSRPTVESVLRDLAATGLVAEAPPEGSGRPGRPARRLVLEPGAASVAALDIGARTVRCLRVDAVGGELSRTAVPLDRSDVPGSLMAALREAGPLPQALGVSVPGVLDAQGRPVHSLVLPELGGLDLARELEDRTGAPVVLENDIKLAAYAELHLGPAADSLALVQIGHRISVALVVHGRILQGAHRLAGELGTERGMRWTRTSRRGRLHWSTGDEARPLLERAGRGEAQALAEVEAFCREIAPRLAALLLAVDPEALVVGGGLSRAGAVLLDPLRAAIQERLTAPGRPRVIGAALPTGGSLVGALGRAFEHGSSTLLGVPGVPPPWTRLGPKTPPPPEGQP